MACKLSGGLAGGKRAARLERLLALGLTLLVGAVVVPPAHADNDRRRHDNGRKHQQQRHEERASGWRREDDAYGYRPRAYTRDYYAQPVYVPPPIYYAPQQSPGISLFFPLDLR